MTVPHAIRRAAERYDVRLDQTDLLVMEEMCRDGEPDRSFGAKEAHVVEYRGRRLPVLYNRTADKIITVYPREVLDRHGRLRADWVLPA